jgi:hypothetical protein
VKCKECKEWLLLLIHFEWPGIFFVALHKVDDHVAWWSFHPLGLWLSSFLVDTFFTVI